VARELLAYAKSLMSAVEREDFIRGLSLKVGVSESALLEELANLPDFKVNLEEVKKSEPQRFEAEDFLVGAVLAFPEVSQELTAELKKFECKKEQNKKIWQMLIENDFGGFFAKDESAEKLRLFASDRYVEFSDAAIKKEIFSIIEKLSKNSKEDQKRDLLVEIHAAEGAGEIEKAAKLLAEYQEMLK
jgi:hypothetical protein